MRNKKQPIRFADVHTLARSKGAIEDVGGRRSCGRRMMSAFAVAIGGKADMGWCSAHVRY
jgi:hypothetical protein